MAVMLWEVALLIVLVDVHLDVEIRVVVRVKEAVKRIVLALAVMDAVRRAQVIAMEDPVPSLIIIHTVEAVVLQTVVTVVEEHRAPGYAQIVVS